MPPCPLGSMLKIDCFRQSCKENGDGSSRQAPARQLSLPDAANDGVEANMTDGVLEIRIPKSEKAVARKIEIKS